MSSKLFSPTYLYIKQHSVTGKLYFGKTSKPYPYVENYLGSGKGIESTKDGTLKSYLRPFSEFKFCI